MQGLLFAIAFLFIFMCQCFCVFSIKCHAKNTFQLPYVPFPINNVCYRVENFMIFSFYFTRTNRSIKQRKSLSHRRDVCLPVGHTVGRIFFFFFVNIWHQSKFCTAWRKWCDSFANACWWSISFYWLSQLPLWIFIVICYRTYKNIIIAYQWICYLNTIPIRSNCIPSMPICHNTWFYYYNKGLNNIVFLYFFCWTIIYSPIVMKNASTDL